MSLGMNSDGALGMHQGAATPSHFYDYPSMGSEKYINNLLGHEAPADGFFSLAEEAPAEAHEQKGSPVKTLMKWGLGIVAAVALWKVATRQKGENLMQGITSKVSEIRKKLSTHPKPTTGAG